MPCVDRFLAWTQAEQDALIPPDGPTVSVEAGITAPWRAVTGLCAMLLWFLALSMMPMAEAVSLSFTAPLFATIGAALFLGEIVRARRWSATALGFLGVLVIVRPGLEALSLPALLVLWSRVEKRFRRT